MLHMTFLIDLVGCGILSLVGLLLAVHLSMWTYGHTTIESLEFLNAEQDMKEKENIPHLSDSKSTQKLNQKLLSTQ